MLYKGEIVWYCKEDEEEVEVGLLIPADNYAEALHIINGAYQDDDILEIKLEQFGPDDFITFYDKSNFETATNAIAKEIIW